MKRLWIAVGIIALLTGLTLGNTGYLNQFTRSQAQTLAQAQACARLAQGAGIWFARTPQELAALLAGEGRKPEQ